MISILLFNLLPSISATFDSDIVKATQHTCPGGQFNCENDQPCCAFDPKEYGCCSGGATESCCSDSLGGVCCVNQPTVCIPKLSDASSYPARCCPRETVGCSAGVVGCCNPARAWQRGPPLNPPSPSPVSRTPSSTTILTNVLVSAMGIEEKYTAAATSPIKYDSSVINSNVAYLLIVGGGMDGNLQSVHVNLTSGAVLHKMDIVGYNTWEESTRDLVYDPTRNVFYALDVNFTGTGSKRPTSGRPVILSIINPLDGSVTTKTVSHSKGAFDYVTGYAVMENGMIHAASRDYDVNGTVIIGSSFYTIDPTTGVGKDLSSIVHKTNDETDPKMYGGYHRAIDIQGENAYRLGYKTVSDQSDPGLGVVNSVQGTAEWLTLNLPDNEHAWYLGMNIIPDTNSSSVVSLAPNSATGHLDLIEWDLPSLNVTRVIKLGNVTGPGVIMGKAGMLGYVLDTSRKETWVGVVSFPNAFPLPFPHALDAWGLAVVDLKSGDVALHPIAPTLLSGGNSISGVGLPKL